jgi:hypothetical protein
MSLFSAELEQRDPRDGKRSYPVVGNYEPRSAERARLEEEIVPLLIRRRGCVLAEYL